VIDPKINIVNNNAGIALADSAVQIRAYELYELRGKIDGWAEPDWYEAETNLRASKQTSVVDTNVQQER
jgi:Protein of unknown function (DUF2934)